MAAPVEKIKNRAFPWLALKNIAHRGLFQSGTVYEENSLPAFEAAVLAGYAIELDVQMTSDKLIAVFHDENLRRLTGMNADICETGLQTVKTLNIGKSGSCVPTLYDVFDLVNKRTPIYIKVKTSENTDIQLICGGIRHALEGYAGDVAVMSFDPRIIAWFKKYVPRFARGLILGREALLSVSDRIKTSYYISRYKPDFLACDINLLPNSLCTPWRKKGRPVTTWTIRSKEQETIGNKHADALTFELPAVADPLPESSH